MYRTASWVQMVSTYIEQGSTVYRTASWVPMVSSIERFHCVQDSQLGPNGVHLYRARFHCSCLRPTKTTLMDLDPEVLDTRGVSIPQTPLGCCFVFTYITSSSLARSTINFIALSPPDDTRVWSNSSLLTS